MKRIVSMLLAICICFTILPTVAMKAKAAAPGYTVSAAYKASSYYSTLCNVTLTGNQRTDIVNVALSQVGYREGSYSGDYSGADDGSYNNYTEYNYWYHNYVNSGMPVGGDSAPWCATFVSWCAEQANIPTSILKRSTAAGHGASYFDVNFYSGSSTLASSGDNDSYFMGYNYSPQAGDLFFTRSWSHVGLVVGVSGNYVITVEGNTNNNGSSQGNGVYKLTWRKITDLYFGVPNYSGDSSDSQRTLDDRYSSFFPIAAFPLSTGRISVYDKAGNLYSNRYIDGATDVCLIWEVYTDGWCKVRYPSSAESSGYFDAYVPFSTFTTSTYPSWWTAPKNYTTYRRSDLASTMHSISSGEDCFLLTTSGDIKQIIHFVSGQDYSMIGWIRDPETEVTPQIRAWVSESAMGESATEYKVGNRYYLCYEMTDAVSGLPLDDVKTYSYSVKLTILLPDGSVGYTYTYTNDDNWISLFIEEPGTYTYKVELTGDFSYSKSMSRTMAENPKRIYASATAVNLTLGGTEREVIYVWTTGYHKGKTVLSWSTSNSNIGCAWGEWNEDNELPLTITAKSPGQSTITLTVKDKGTNAVLDTCIVNVTVSASSYTVSYNANGGSGAPASQIKSHGTALTLSTTIPSRFGYTFIGWSASPSATTPTYHSGDSYANDASVTLYAVWAEADEWNYNWAGFTRTAYIRNGGAGVYYKITPNSTTNYRMYGTGEVDTVIYIYDESGKKLAYNDDGGSNHQFFLEYSFAGNTTYYIYVKFYSSSETGSLPFQIDKRYSISYNANGGSSAPATQYRYYGETVTLSTKIPTWEGYSFQGWATSSGATSATYQPGDNYSRNANMTLYAVWKANCDNAHSYTYKVTKTPSTSATGTLTGTCAKCSGATTVTLPKLSTTDYTYKVVTEATCTVNGTGRYTWKTTAYGTFYFDVTISKLDHNYEGAVAAPTCKAQGYTIYTCTVCGDSYVVDYTDPVDHSYEDGSCIWCGEEQGHTIQWISATTSLNGTIDLNIYVALSDNILNDPDAYVRFIRNGVVVDVPVSEGVEAEKRGQICYRYSCEIFAKQVADTITIQVMNADGAISDVLEYSVMRYCVNQIKNSPDAELVKLCKALLNYATAAQIYFNHNPENPANASLSDADKALPDVDASAYKFNVVGSEPGIKPRSATLNLESEVAIRVYFIVEEGYDIADFTFAIDGVEVPIQQNEKGYYIESDGIAAKELDDMHQFTVGGLTVNYGALSYVNSKAGGSNINEANLAKALFAYYVAAEALLG